MAQLHHVTVTSDGVVPAGGNQSCASSLASDGDGGDDNSDDGSRPLPTESVVRMAHDGRSYRQSEGAGGAFDEEDTYGDDSKPCFSMRCNHVGAISALVHTHSGQHKGFSVGDNEEGSLNGYEVASGQPSGTFPCKLSPAIRH